MQLYFLCLYVFRSCFRTSSVDLTVWLLLETNQSITKFISSLTLFWCSTPFTLIVVFWMIILRILMQLLFVDRSAVKGLFWVCETMQKLNILKSTYVFDLAPKCCSGMIEGTWIQLLFYFLVLVNVAALLRGMSFFIYGSGCRLKFWCIAVLRKRLQFDFKSGLTTNGMILQVFD